jgi:TetR/AcrR family transcriptional repressor of mexCD-oprJ operon
MSLGGRRMTVFSRPADRPYGRRADAERNRESVLDHAARLLAENPAAGMAEIAAESKIGRATLYRHFPTRESLIEAITDRAVDDVERAIAASRLDEGTACEALRRLVAALLDVGDRYRFLIVQETVRSDREQRLDIERRLSGPLLALFERGRDAGEFSHSFSPAWMSVAFGGLMVVTVHEVATGQMERADAKTLVLATLLHGLLQAEDPA